MNYDEINFLFLSPLKHFALLLMELMELVHNSRHGALYSAPCFRKRANLYIVPTQEKLQVVGHQVVGGDLGLKLEPSETV